MSGTTDRLTNALADRYRIERELGQGGMATVYLAEDLKHDRKVALKVLKPELAAVLGAERFVQEIKTTAALQHPHILPLFDSGSADGFLYYVMPYVEGETLRDKLNRETQLSIDEAVRITTDVADALQYAHEHGVIHRDIKPENILLHAGRPMVADFGIALALSAAAGGRMTETGMSLGTPHYMSPEQATADKDISARSDVYSLASVLYEMLTGQPPHLGGSAQQIIMKIIAEPVAAVTTLRKSVPPNVAAAVGKALEKLPADRFDSAKAFAEALTNPTFRTETIAAPASATAVPPYRRPALLGAAALATLIIGLLAGRALAPAPRQSLIEFPVPLPDSVVSISRCCGDGIALSPDGRTLVFVGSKGGISGPLYRRVLGRVEAEPIPGTESGATPFFSPDGHWLGFAADGKLKKVSMAGGPPIPIVSASRVFEASWSSQGTIVYSVAGDSLLTVPASGGTPTTLIPADSTNQYFSPSFLPDGRAVLVTIQRRGSALADWRIGVVDLATHRLDTLGLGTRALYGNGYLVFAGADNTLLAQPFDPKRRHTTGQAVAILAGVTNHSGTHEFALSGAGLAYEPGGGGPGSSGEVLRLVGASGSEVIPLPGRSGVNLEDPAFSPDGSRIALRLPGENSGSSTNDIWILDRRQNTLGRFTVNGGYAPVWSPDGKRIAYRTDDGIYVRNADGTGAPQLVLKGARLFPGSWLPSGKAIVFGAFGQPKTGADIGLITLGDSAPRWLVATEFHETEPQLSPDGHWLAYRSNRTGHFEIYVQPLGSDGPRVQVSSEGGGSPRWSPDGRTLYYVGNGQIIAARRAPGAGFTVASRTTAATVNAIDLNGPNVNWDVAPDGKAFLYIDQSGATSGGTGIVWILGWPQLVRMMAAGTQ